MVKMILSGNIAVNDFEFINGYLEIKDGVITKIREEECPNSSDYSGIILPSFINAHTHIGDNSIDVDPMNHSLPDLVGPGGIKEEGLSNLDDEVKTQGMMSALKNAISSGVTGICDFREGGVEGARLLYGLKEEVQVDIKIFGRPKEFTKNEIIELIPLVDGLGISSVNDLRDNDLDFLKKVIKEEDINVALHAAETLSGQRKALKSKNKTEISQALEFDPDYLVHVTHPLQDDLELIEKTDTSVVICPRSNQKTGVGEPPFEELLNRDIDLGIGTDNAMINSPSILKEIGFLVKNYFNDTEEISNEKLKTIFKIATIDNGKIIGTDNRIKEGRKPNLVIYEQRDRGLKSIVEGKNKIKKIIK